MTAYSAAWQAPSQMLKLSPRLQSSISPFTGPTDHNTHKGAPCFSNANHIWPSALFLRPSCSVQMETPPLVISAASVLKELCYQNKEELQAGFITAGWDSRKGPQVTGSWASHMPACLDQNVTCWWFMLQVYVVSLGGMLLRQPVTIGGSGSTYIYGYVDAKYKPNMSREECLQFATNGTCFIWLIILKCVSYHSCWRGRSKERSKLRVIHKCTIIITVFVPNC